MGLFVFFLVVLPVLALTAFPVTTRRLARRGAAPDAPRETITVSSAAAKGIDSMRWMRSAEEHIRCLKSVA